MSKYTGKCDFCDTIEIAGGYEEWNKGDNHVYIGAPGVKDDGAGNYERDMTGVEEITWEKESDLMPYYPYIVATAGCSKNDDGTRSGNYFLSREPYWVEMEKWSSTDYLVSCKKKLEEDIAAAKSEGR